MDLIYYDHPLLRERAEPVEEVTEIVRGVATRLQELCEEKQALGLAAPHIGQLLRIIVVRADGDSIPQIWLNPQISRPSKEKERAPEGSVSFPGVVGLVERPKRIHLRACTLDGERIERDLEGLEARVVMHENDQLNGVHFTSRMAKADRERLRPKLRVIHEKYNGL